MTNRRKVWTTSNHHAPYALGYTRVTMAGTASGETVMLSKSQKTGLSSDSTLQLECLKSESLVNWKQRPKAGLVTGVKS